MVLSYALNTTHMSQTPQATNVHSISAKGLPQEKLDLLSHILKEVYSRVAAVRRQSQLSRGDGDDELDGKPIKRHPFEDIYEAICAVILSRTLQAVLTRPSAKEIFLALPSVPSGSLSLLKLLVYTGTKAVTAPPQGARRDQTQPRNRGTRAEALSLLGQLVFSNDETAGEAALKNLCWCSLADDFEIRSKAISLLVG